MNRRSFMSVVVPLLSTVVLSVRTAKAQTAATQNKKVIVCGAEAPVTCPLGHQTCREIDAHLVVGGNNREAPDWAVDFDHRQLRCTVCGVLFAEKN